VVARVVRAIAGQEFTDEHLVVEPRRTILTDRGTPILNEELREWCLHAGLNFTYTSGHFQLLFDDDTDAWAYCIVLKFKHKSDMALFKLTWDGVIPEKRSW
jgi:hypothetical protein